MDLSDTENEKIETYTKKALSQRNDVRLIIVIAPIVYSCAWPIGAWLGMLYATGINAAIALLLKLSSFWFVRVNTWMCYNVEHHVEKATLAIVTPASHRGKPQICAIHRSHFEGSDHKSKDEVEIFFDFWHSRYIYEQETKSFKRLNFEVQYEFSYHLKNSGYGKESTVQAAQTKWGTNEFVFPKPEFLPMLGEHMLAPFFVFQLFCVALWCLDEYWYYSLFTLVMLIFFECTVVKQRLKNLDTLQDMGHKLQHVMVHRGGKWEIVSEKHLLPGDIISLGSKQGQGESFVPADCLLLAGTGITNESILTGESIPQWKIPVKGRNATEVFSWKDDKQHILYRGSTLIQHENDSEFRIRTPDKGLLAEVLRTGFNTTQGDLMRTILHSTERMSANSSEAGLFILFLMVFAIAASGYVLYHGLTSPDRDLFRLTLNCIMIITSVIPPELPMELSLAVNTSMLSLFKRSIFCTEPFRIPYAGKVDACCFDKTGTLTASNLIFEGIGNTGSSPLDRDPELPSNSDFATKVLVGVSLAARSGWKDAWRSNGEGSLQKLILDIFKEYGNT